MANPYFLFMAEQSSEVFFVFPHAQKIHHITLIGSQLSKTTETLKFSLWVGITIIPGYNDSALDRTFEWSMNREDRKVLEKLYLFAKRANPDSILLTSFNEWHEGTEVEPSIEFSDKYIKILERLRIEKK